MSKTKGSAGGPANDTVFWYCRSLATFKDESAAMTTLLEEFVCKECGALFESRNKLFRHLKATDKDHAAFTTTAAEVIPPLKKHRGDHQTQLPSNHSFPLADEGIRIVREDDWYQVISKPQGLSTMGPKGVTVLKSDRMLLPDAIKLNFSYKKAVPCHRLDKETGGILLCSKSKLAERTIMACFRHKVIHKKYMAIVIGKVEPTKGTITSPLSGKPACTKYAVSSYTRSAQYEWLTTVELWPVTGKKHQLRKHMHSIGHSIVGDAKYTLPRLWDTIVRTDIPHMFLWAVEIDFPHPRHCVDLAGNNTEDDGADEGKSLLCDAEDSDDDGAADALSTDERLRQAVERVRALPPDCRVTAGIPEPPYYSQFRELHERSWDSTLLEKDGASTTAAPQ